jgi:hypothetical protein
MLWMGEIGTAPSRTPPNKPLQTDHQQLSSIDLGCRLAAYFWGWVGSGQRFCWPLNADPLGVTVSR